MLEDFKLSQENFYHEVIQFGLHQKFSHAYLIETKDYLDSDNLVLAFAKFLYCPYHYTNSSNCGDCNRCHLIDLSTNSDVMVISPDGSWIKKEQVQEIKDKFMTTSLENNVRIYIIKEADKLNKQAANALLKFLEEPDNQLIGILVCRNRYQVLETLQSRCQLLSLSGEQLVPVNMENEDFLSEFINVIETKKEAAIAFIPSLLANEYWSKDEWSAVFEQLAVIYEQALRKSVLADFSSPFSELVDQVLKYNTTKDCLRKLEVIHSYIQKLTFNLNVSLMLDSFIIDFSGGEYSHV